jgi:hypothetical protein
MKRILTLVVLFLVLMGVEVMAASYYQTYLPIVSRQATPTPSPTPTATSFPEAVQILPRSYVYESVGMMHVVGEVLNNTGFSLYFVEVYVRFYDAFGQDVGIGSTVMEPFNLPAWERGCFIINMDVPLEWSTYEFDEPIYESGNSSPNLTILASTWSYDPAFGDYDIFGWVRNDGSQRSYSVGVGGTLYNPADVPVGCEHSFVTDYDLIPGQISDFSLKFSGDNRDYYDVDDYRLRVAGDLS